MTDRGNPTDPLRRQLKYFIVESLGLEGANPEAIRDDEPIVGGSLDLDSLDALELVIRLEDEFGIAVRDHVESRSPPASIASLADLIRGEQGQARLSA